MKEMGSVTRNPLVSVVVSFLNEERFLGDAVRSVLAQDFQDWELLLVDDGSEDGSTDMARAFASASPERVRYIEHAGHANRGLSASRNEGVRQARGKLFCFLDADDCWLSNRLDAMIAVFRANPEAGMIVEATRYWKSWENLRPESDEEIRIGAPQDTAFLPFELSRRLYPLGSGAAPCPSAITVTRQAFNNAGGFEEDFGGEYSLYEDQAFLAKVYIREVVYVSAACNVLYRLRANSISSRVSGPDQYRRIRKFFLEWFEKHLRSTGYENAEIAAQVRTALLPCRKPWVYSVRRRVRTAMKRFRQRGLSNPGAERNKA